ncbi:hypothetical protein Tco_1074932, partial [Tanacetum coccineum]
KGIDARALHEESLRIKEKVVKERIENERHMLKERNDQKRSAWYILEYFKILEDFSKEDLTNIYFSNRFQRAFSSFFGEDIEYFAPRLFFNMDKLEKKLNEAEFNEEITMVVFNVFNNQFQQFITQHISMDYDQMENKFFTEYTLCDAQTFKDILIHQMDSVEKVIVERGLYKRAHDSRVNKRMTQMKKGMVNMVKDKYDDGFVVKAKRGTKSEI